MFEFNTWIVDNLISGVKNGSFSREWAAVQLGNYFVKDRITESDIARFDEATEPVEVENNADEITEEV